MGTSTGRGGGARVGLTAGTGDAGRPARLRLCCRAGRVARPTTVDSFALHAGGWTMNGGSGRYTLHAGLPGYTLDLALHSTERPVLEGPDGTLSVA